MILSVLCVNLQHGNLHCIPHFVQLQQIIFEFVNHSLFNDMVCKKHGTKQKQQETKPRGWVGENERLTDQICPAVQNNKDIQRKLGVNRILCARGQEKDYNSNERYTFSYQLSPERITALRQAIVDWQWRLMAEEQRETFLWEWLPEGADYYGLLIDFRHGGFRMLGDPVCDVDDLEAARERKQLRRPADSPAFQKMIEAYLSAPFSSNELAAVSMACRKLLDKVVRPSLAAPTSTAVALGRQNLLWDLLPDHIKEHALEVDHGE